MSHKRCKNALAIRTYQERYGHTRVCPTNGRTIVKAIQRLRENQPLIPHSDSAPPQVRVNFDERILNHFRLNPTTSLRRAAHHLRVPHSSVHKILKLDKRKPFKYKKVQTLLTRDMSTREEFCNSMLRKNEEIPDFLFNVMWTDESTFTKNGLWNRHNLRHWSTENPRLTRDSSHQNRFAINVWAGIHRNTIIGPIFIDGNLNAENFLLLLNKTVSEYMNELSLDVYRQTWYQLDGAPAHSVISARARLTEMFGEQWIGRYGPTRWPPRSPDLTPLDFFMGLC